MDNVVQPPPKGSTMNRKSLAAALVLIASAGSVLADDISGEDRAIAVRQPTAVAPAQRATVNVYAKDYNPLHSFQGVKTRAQVTAEFQASREEVAAFTREDSGAAWLAARRPVGHAPVLAGQPVNAH
jgi:hypothetical protein